MCRWMVYVGKPIIMADIVTRPQNSIVHQSRHSPYLPFVHGHHGEAKVMNTAINGDGFGVGWYDNFGPEPCVFRSVLPSWNCTNLQAIANHVQTHCAFAHVRAASNGSIAEANCHPFKFGKMIFMQNGTIAHFTKIRVAILEEIKDTTATMIEGMTDSEHAGALFVHFLPGSDPNADHSGHVMKDAVLKMLKFILDRVKDEEERTEKVEGVRMHTPSNMNFAVTDGTVMIATRYRDSKISHPPSLYFSEVKQLHLHGGDPENGSGSAGVEIDWQYPSDQDEVESVVVASEPLTRQPKNWMLVPRNHLLVITAHQRTIIEAIDIEEAEAETVEEAPADELEVKNEIEETQASEWDLAGWRSERITGEEEWREEVLNDPRNLIKVGKNQGSEEEQRKLKQELKEKAPDYTLQPDFPGRRRHSLASWYPRMASSSNPSAAVNTMIPLTALPPTSGHASPPMIHRANSSLGIPCRHRPHKRPDRLEVSPSYCTHTAPLSPAPRSSRSASLPFGTLDRQPSPDLYSSPASPPTSLPSSPATTPSHSSSSPMSFKLVETGGEVDVSKRSRMDQQKATRDRDERADHEKPIPFRKDKGAGLTKEGQMKDAMGLQQVKYLGHPAEELQVRAAGRDAGESLKKRGKAKRDELGSSLKDKAGSVGQALAVPAAAGKRDLASMGEVHIRLDISKGFLLLAVINILCALLWATKG